MGYDYYQERKKAELMTKHKSILADMIMLRDKNIKTLEKQLRDIGIAPRL